MARGLGARRSNELYGGLLGDYLKRAGGLLAERAGEVISGQALEEYIQSLFPGFGAYQIVDGKITFPEARAPQGGYEGLLGEMFGAGMSAPMGGLLHTVWHGSPHRWDVPDISKVGTGEGAQAYGHGFYSTDTRAIAEGYQREISQRAGIADEWFLQPQGDAASNELREAIAYADAAPMLVSQMISDIGTDSVPEMVGAIRYSASVAKPEYRDAYNKIADMIEGGRIKVDIPQGYLYKLDIPDEDIARYLDWDKPLSEQSEEIKKLFPPDKYPETFTGASLYDRLARTPGIAGSNRAYDEFGQSAGRAAASSHLEKLGIPGIRYLDGNSRGAGAGSYNYVTFDPSRIRVLERNGQGLLSMGTRDYGTMHRPMTVESGAATLDDLIPAFGEDVYGKNALQFFGSGDNREKRVLNILRQVRGKPDAKIKIYRGIPNGADGKINPGDWVTLDKEVAAEYGPQVIEMEVPVKDVTSWADSLLEFGYYPRKP